MPLATAGGFSSYGTAFLLTIMPAASRAASASFPVMPLFDKVEEHQMGIGSTRDDLIATIDESLRQGFRIGQTLAADSA